MIIVSYIYLNILSQLNYIDDKLYYIICQNLIIKLIFSRKINVYHKMIILEVESQYFQQLETT